MGSVSPCLECRSCWQRHGYSHWMAEKLVRLPGLELGRSPGKQKASLGCSQAETGSREPWLGWKRKYLTGIQVGQSWHTPTEDGQEVPRHKTEGQARPGTQNFGSHLLARAVVAGPGPELQAHLGLCTLGLSATGCPLFYPHTMDNWMVITRSKMKHSRGKKKEMLRGSTHYHSVGNYLLGLLNQEPQTG